MRVRRRGSNVLNVGQPLCITILLFAVSAVNASPTTSQQDAILTTVSPSVDTLVTTSQDIDTIAIPTNTELAALGIEFLRPSASSIASNNTRSNIVKSLPAVPAAILMVLTGFLCVSLVRDRRVWLAVLTGILWVGQAGIQALPQLALRLSHRNHIEQLFSTELICRCYIKSFPRLRSDTEGTQYTGLLPERQYRLNPLLKCRAYYARQYARFSPAFTFENLPRGPPNQV